MRYLIHHGHEYVTTLLPRTHLADGKEGDAARAALNAKASTAYAQAFTRAATLFSEIQNVSAVKL